MQSPIRSIMGKDGHVMKRLACSRLVWGKASIIGFMVGLLIWASATRVSLCPCFNWINWSWEKSVTQVSMAEAFFDLWPMWPWHWLECGSLTLECPLVWQQWFSPSSSIIGTIIFFLSMNTFFTGHIFFAVRYLSRTVRHISNPYLLLDLYIRSSRLTVQWYIKVNPMLQSYKSRGLWEYKASTLTDI